MTFTTGVLSREQAALSIASTRMPDDLAETPTVSESPTRKLLPPDLLYVVRTFRPRRSDPAFSSIYTLWAPSTASRSDFARCASPTARSPASSTPGIFVARARCASVESLKCMA